MSASQSQEQIYFDGVKKGIGFGVEWNTLSTGFNHLKCKVAKYEEDFVDPLAPRLGPQLDALGRQMTIEYDELADLMDDENGVNRETEFESLLYNFMMFRFKFNKIKQMHDARIKKAKRLQRRRRQQQQDV